MRSAHPLQLAAVLSAVFCAQAIIAQNSPIVPIKAPPVTAKVENLSYRTMGTIGSRGDSYHPNAVTVSHQAPNEVPGIPAPGFYPGDVSNPGDGPTVESWKAHPVYINSDPGIWGDVGGFLNDLGRSQMVHVIDQYVGSNESHRYKLGTQYLASYPIPTPGVPTATSQTLVIQDIVNLVYAGASAGGSGYGNIYHIFIPPGVDMCLVYPSITECYSPDNPNTWYFCAFHGSIDFSGPVGHVLFSVEPYQNVNGCSVPPGTPNGQLKDSTDNVLSHESFEAISDPDGTAWWVQSGAVLEGEEIGDNCVRSAQFPQYNNNYYWNYGVVSLNGHPYTIQPEYSNEVHGCAYGVLNP